MQKKIKINFLGKRKFGDCEINPVWKINDIEHNFPFCHSNEYYIFGRKINLECIEWHKDLISGFEYPLKRFDKINAEQWFNKGIELKFPWEVSRFYFAVNLGQKYLITKDTIYYEKFKNLVLDWIEKNPFLYGVNWLSTMEVAIRAINWIVGLNLFYKIFNEDPEFKNKLSCALAQHAEYIYKFPEIYENGSTTNHTITGYTGLLFTALTLKNLHLSNVWIETAIKGLEKCIKNQVYNDGVDFEASIPYHRLVLELFSFSTILVLLSNLNLSKQFYEKLFKMFEYSSAYIDKNGNAPQVGDNDSGRILIFNAIENNNYYENEHNHSYLLTLGEHIFNYNFQLKLSKNYNYLINFLPISKKIDLEKIGVKGRDTEKSICFKEGGAYILKNEIYDLFIIAFPLGQGGKGGHNHFDTGSFTLSMNGTQVIVDPGTYCYSSNKSERDKFRSYKNHNTLYKAYDSKIEYDHLGIWELKKYYESKILMYNENELGIEINFLNDPRKRKRTFKLENKSLIIIDEYEGDFYSRINLHPDICILNKSKYEINTKTLMIKSSSSNYILSDYDYSPTYNIVQKSCCINFYSQNKLIIEIKSIY